MYEKPHLNSRTDSLRIDIVAEQADRLLKDLQDAGFHAQLLKDTFAYEDLNSDTGREEVVSIELSSSADKLAVRKFLRGWKA